MNKVTCLTVTNRRPEEVTKETKLSKERLSDDVLARELPKFQLGLAARSAAASTPRARKATSLIAPSLLAAPTPSSLVGALPGLVKALEGVTIHALERIDLVGVEVRRAAVLVLALTQGQELFAEQPPVLTLALAGWASAATIALLPAALSPVSLLAAALAAAILGTGARGTWDLVPLVRLRKLMLAAGTLGVLELATPVVVVPT